MLIRFTAAFFEFAAAAAWAWFIGAGRSGETLPGIESSCKSHYVGGRALRPEFRRHKVHVRRNMSKEIFISFTKII